MKRVKSILSCKLRVIIQILLQQSSFFSYSLRFSVSQCRSRIQNLLIKKNIIILMKIKGKYIISEGITEWSRVESEVLPEFFSLRLVFSVIIAKKVLSFLDNVGENEGSGIYFFPELAG